MKIRYLPFAVVLFIVVSCSSWKHGDSNAKREYPRFQHQRIEPVPYDTVIAHLAPNPFSPVIPPVIELPKDGMTTVLVCDPDGQELDTLVHKYLEQGVYCLPGYAPGRWGGVVIFVVKLNGKITSSKKAIILH